MKKAEGNEGINKQRVTENAGRVRIDMQHAQKQKYNEVRSFWLGGRLSPVLDMYLAASSGLRVYGAQNWEGQRQKWRRIKVSRIVCFCAHSHEVLRVQPISARGSKTARLHMRAMECCSKRGTQVMPLSQNSQVITLHVVCLGESKRCWPWAWLIHRL